MRAVLVASVFLALQAHAQTPTPSPTPGATPLAQAPAVPVPLQVERLAPQLVGFAGSPGNFESLVNGLAAGVPVTLTTATADGVTQTVTFTPPGGAVSRERADHTIKADLANTLIDRIRNIDVADRIQAKLGNFQVSVSR